MGIASFVTSPDGFASRTANNQEPQEEPFDDRFVTHFAAAPERYESIRNMGSCEKIRISSDLKDQVRSYPGIYSSSLSATLLEK